MSENSKVLKSLKKGDIVKVEFEMDGPGGTWCGITEEDQSDVRGYVLCRDLNQEVRQGKTWKMINSTGIREGAKESSSVGRHEMDNLLQSNWTGLKNALRKGDIPGALNYIVKSKRSEYEKVFRTLYVPLAQIDKVLTDITLIEMSAADAEYQMVRTDVRGRTAYMVRFGIDEDGVWRIYGF